jgi:uncharacterized protein YbaA (DUF1428 family)
LLRLGDVALPGTPSAISESYRKHAEAAAVVFKEHDALKLMKCWGDDMPDGKVTSFPMAVKKQADETVVFCWIHWPSRAVRYEGMKKVMADPRLQPNANPMPFDGKRLIYGGSGANSGKRSASSAMLPSQTPENSGQPYSSAGGSPSPCRR